MTIQQLREKGQEPKQYHFTTGVSLEKIEKTSMFNHMRSGSQSPALVVRSGIVIAVCEDGNYKPL